MRGRRNSLWTTIWISLVVLLLAVGFQFVRFPRELYQLQNLCVILLLGAVSGTVVALIIFLEEYRNAKSTTLERYYVVAAEVLAAFRKLKYFLAKEPNELLIRYYDEVEHNRLAQNFRDHMPTISAAKLEEDGLHTIRHDVRDEWCSLLEPGYLSMRDKMDPDKFHRMLEDEVARRAEEYLTQLGQVIDSYVTLWDEAAFGELDHVYGQIGFFTGKKPCERIYKIIQGPLHRRLNGILITAGERFGAYKTGEDPSPANLLRALVQVQNENFTTVIQEEKGGKATVVFNDFYTETAHVLEDFRVKLYGGEPKYPNRYCVRSAVNL